MRTVLTFEKPIHDIETRIADLRKLQEDGGPDVSDQLALLESRLKDVQADIFRNLSAWDQVQMARWQDRPYTLEYVAGMTGDTFFELHGDRKFGDDPAIVGGMAVFRGQSVMILGHQKARDLKGRQFRNFGSARPEGYRKAIRLMKLADKLRLPLITFIDTPAADTSPASEARGISEAIAASMYEMSQLGVPIVVTVIGEGGSGGAIGIGVGDRVMMLEHAIYSVIPPEGCANILWKDGARADEAAESLKLTAQDALRLGVIDEVIPEPFGGAHRDQAKVIADTGNAIAAALDRLSQLTREELIEQRYRRLRNMGQCA